MNKSSGIFGFVVVIIFGSLWTALAIGMTSAAPDEMPFTMVKVIFPAFGFLFIGLGVFNLVKTVKSKNKNEHSDLYYTDSEETEEKEYKVYRADKSKKCPMCHSTVSESQKFCTNCGNKLDE